MCKDIIFHFFFLVKVLHPALRELELCECTITDSGLACLSICKNLRKLDLNATKNSRESITSDGKYRSIFKPYISHPSHFSTFTNCTITEAQSDLQNLATKISPYINSWGGGGVALL